MKTQIQWRDLVNKWVIAAAILFGLLLFGLALGLLALTRPSSAPVQPATPLVNAIPAPTDTPAPAPTEITVTLTPTRSVPAAPAPGAINVGDYVQIAGTGGDGLRLRTEPGLNSQVRMLGVEAEVFTVNDGPRESDDYVWYYLVGLYDASRSGWAVSNYLEVVQQP